MSVLGAASFAAYARLWAANEARAFAEESRQLSAFLETPHAEGAFGISNGPSELEALRASEMLLSEALDRNAQLEAQLEQSKTALERMRRDRNQLLQEAPALGESDEGEKPNSTTDPENEAGESLNLTTIQRSLCEKLTHSLHLSKHLDSPERSELQEEMIPLCGSDEFRAIDHGSDKGSQDGIDTEFQRRKRPRRDKKNRSRDRELAYIDDSSSTAASQGIGAEPQFMSEIARSLATTLLDWEGWNRYPTSTPPRIVVMEPMNRTRFRVDTTLVSAILIDALVGQSEGSFVIFDRSMWDKVQAERQMKHEGTIGGTVSGTDLFLYADLRDLVASSGAVESSLVQVNFRLVNASTTNVVWASQYEWRKAGAWGSSYQ